MHLYGGKNLGTSRSYRDARMRELADYSSLDRAQRSHSPGFHFGIPRKGF